MSLVERRAPILHSAFKKLLSREEGSIPLLQLHAGSLLKRTVTGGNFIPGYLKTT